VIEIDKKILFFYKIVSKPLSSLFIQKYRLSTIFNSKIFYKPSSLDGITLFLRNMLIKHSFKNLMIVFRQQIFGHKVLKKFNGIEF